jgi:hypothetical protein
MSLPANNKTEFVILLMYVLQVVIRQSLSALHHLMVCPAVVPGAGCLEMSLAVRLQDQVVHEWL